jgi:archaellum component FlaG (FlaF/FlaG flagellin family)
MNGTSQVPPAPGMPPVKKGMSPLAWVGIGCVVILIFAGIAVGIMGYFAKRAVDKFAKNPTMTAAELMVRANPDLELVNADEKTNTLTVKDKKTGEVTTFSAEDAKNGKFTIKTDKGGTATFDTSSGKGLSVQSTDEKGQVSTFNAGGGAPQSLPAWLPTYPGGTVQGTMDTTNNEERTAAFTVSTKDDSNKVLDYYEAQLKSAGLKTEKSTYNTNGQTGGTVSGKSDDGKRQASVILSSSTDGTQAMVSFTEKK